MNPSFLKIAFKLLAAAAFVSSAPLALAGGHTNVNWSINIGTPAPVIPVYAAPPVVYVQPQPVYVRPQPVYVQPAAVVQYGAPYYVEEVRYRKHHHRHHYGY